MKTFRSSAVLQRTLWLAIIVGLAGIFYPTTSFAPPSRNHGWGARPLSQIQLCTPPPANMVAWWPGDGNANDIQNGNNGTLENGATATATGMVLQAFSFDGADDYVLVPDAPSLNYTDFTANQARLDLFPIRDGASSNHQAMLWLDVRGRLRFSARANDCFISARNRRSAQACAANNRCTHRNCS
jgi:hypothetical protein